MEHWSEKPLWPYAVFVCTWRVLLLTQQSDFWRRFRGTSVRCDWWMDGRRRERGHCARWDLCPDLRIFIQRLDGGSQEELEFASLRAACYTFQYDYRRLSLIRRVQKVTRTHRWGQFFRDQRTHAPITKIESLYLNRVACVQFAKKAVMTRGGYDIEQARGGATWKRGSLVVRTDRMDGSWVDRGSMELDLIFQQRTPEKEKKRPVSFGSSIE